MHRVRAAAARYVIATLSKVIGISLERLLINGWHMCVTTLYPPCRSYLNASGLMWETAPEMSAMLVFAEHRYYGAALAGAARLAPGTTWISLMRMPVHEGLDCRTLNQIDRVRL